MKIKLSKNCTVKVAQMSEQPNDVFNDSLNDVEHDDLENAEDNFDNDEMDMSKFDARQEAATPHANAAKELFAKRRALLAEVKQIDDQLDRHRDVLRALDPKMKHTSYADDKELRNYLRPEKEDDKKKRRKKIDKRSEVEVIEGLLKVAEVLDYNGDTDGVAMVEGMLKAFAKKEKQPYDVQTIEKTERKYPEIKAPAPTMSTRYCPDHRVYMKRVGNSSWQCPITGTIYNWEDGFKDAEGNVYPPSTIQTADFPDTSSRMFETREMALNKNVK